MLGFHIRVAGHGTLQEKFISNSKRNVVGDH